MITSPKERDLVVNIHQFSLAGLPEARPSVSCQYFFPASNRTGRLGERQHLCVSSSFLPPPHSTILLTVVQATWQGANVAVIAFLKGNNVKDKQSL